MIRRALALGPVGVILLGVALVGAAGTQVTIEPMPTPQIIWVTPEPSPSASPTPSPSPTPTPEPTPSPSPTPEQEVLPLPIPPPPIIPLPSIPLPSIPPLPSAPVCDREVNGQHTGWTAQGRDCPGKPMVTILGILLAAGVAWRSIQSGLFVSSATDARMTHSTGRPSSADWLTRMCRPASRSTTTIRVNGATAPDGRRIEQTMRGTRLGGSTMPTSGTASTRRSRE